MTALNQQENPFTICQGCKPGYYSVLTGKSNKCVPEKDIQAKPIENCSEGGVVLYGQAKCFRCKYGYSRDEQGLECVKRTVKGCLINSFTDAFKCRSCDYFSGYFMDKAGDCVKTANFAK